MKFGQEDRPDSKVVFDFGAFVDIVALAQDKDFAKRIKTLSEETKKFEKENESLAKNKEDIEAAIAKNSDIEEKAVKADVRAKNAKKEAKEERELLKKESEVLGKLKQQLDSQKSQLDAREEKLNKMSQTLSGKIKDQDLKHQSRMEKVEDLEKELTDKLAQVNAIFSSKKASQCKSCV